MPPDFSFVLKNPSRARSDVAAKEKEIAVVGKAISGANSVSKRTPETLPSDREEAICGTMAGNSGASKGSGENPLASNKVLVPSVRVRDTNVKGADTGGPALFWVPLKD